MPPFKLASLFQVLVTVEVEEASLEVDEEVVASVIVEAVVALVVVASVIIV